jgi:hypothetical protein
MGIMHRIAVLVGLACCGLSGCPGDDEDSSSASDPSAASAPESSTEPTTEGAPESTGDPGTDSGETTSGLPLGCGDATTPEVCNAIENDEEDCQWFDTTIVADAAVCTEATGAGTCVNLTGLDGCAHPEPEPLACEGSDLRWFYAEHEDGGWELFQATGEVCGNLPPGFSECYDPSYYEDEPEIAAVCACACSLE